MFINKIIKNNEPEAKDKVSSENESFYNLLQKRISNIKRKIIFGLLVSIGLTVIISIIWFYYSDLKKTSDMQLNQIVNYIANLKNKTSDIELKVNDAKKYKQIWRNTKESQRKFEGANINQINEDFTQLSEKYNIINPTIKISVPEVLKGGIFDRSTIDASLSTISISYDALTDVKAIAFIREFIDDLPGYVVISEFSVKKNLESGFSNTDLVNISLGKFISGVSTKVELSWYILKKKNQPSPNK